MDPVELYEMKGRRIIYTKGVCQNQYVMNEGGVCVCVNKVFTGHFSLAYFRSGTHKFQKIRTFVLRYEIKERNEKKRKEKDRKTEGSKDLVFFFEDFCHLDLQKKVLEKKKNGTVLYLYHVCFSNWKKSRLESDPFRDFRMKPCPPGNGEILLRKLLTVLNG